MTLSEPLVLYERADCHLCHQVQTMLDQAGIRWRPVDVDDDAGLEEKYGLRIPVLQRPDTGRELFYPFDERGLLDFVGHEPQ
jgi:hypothetical protein